MEPYGTLWNLIQLSGFVKNLSSSEISIFDYLNNERQSPMESIEHMQGRQWGQGELFQELMNTDAKIKRSSMILQQNQRNSSNL